MKKTLVMASHRKHVSGQSPLQIYADLKRCAEEFTLDKVLGGIHYFRCHDYVELVALVNILPQFIAQHPKVRQVEVDISHRIM